MKMQPDKQGGGNEGLKVFISHREATCCECGEHLDKKAWITFAGDNKVLCLACADLDHLVFLPAGDAALTRRARKYSTLSAVVLQWSRSRKRYERQGVLVEKQALEQAEAECLDDSEIRERRRTRDAARREALDHQYVEQFAARIRELYPQCPTGREREIAEYACLKRSRRVGRSAAAKDLDEQAMRLAVIAHVRHRETQYEKLCAQVGDKWIARGMVEEDIRQVLQQWEGR
jgi:hypothetical protein